jgi:Zn-dependent metalloprotease
MKRILSVCVLLLISGIPTAFGQGRSDDAHERALAHFRANARAYGLTDPDRELRTRQSFRDELGQTHTRFDQLHQGVRVFEGEAIAHDAGAGPVDVTSALAADLAIDVTPRIPESVAVAKAIQALGAHGGETVQSAELVILPGGRRVVSTRLVWHVVVFAENDADDAMQRDSFIDAKSGEVVWSFDSLETSNVTGTARTQYLGSQTANLDLQGSTYNLRDVLRSTGNRTCDMQNTTSSTCPTFTSSTSTFGDGRVDSTNRQTSAADAHIGLQKTWDYYKSIHGRNGIDGNGTATRSRVHYSSGYDNAFWNNSCFCMTYGDGTGTPGGTSGFLPVVAIDVAGHEMTHGVTSRTANLTYSGESGGLNEATSDIFGTMVEFFTNSTADVPDYLIGERIKPANWNSDGTWKNLASPAALRYMDRPSRDGNSRDCWSSGLGSLNVHYSSGPANHMYYLLSNGGTSACNGRVVTGITNAKAQRIWYRALTVYMTSSTNYAGARTAALNAARDLYGSGSVEYNTVASAFSAINVN